MFDALEIPLPCLKCGNETKKTVAWLKANDHFVCPCGSRIKVDASELLGSLKQHQSGVGDLRRAIQKTGKFHH